MTKFKSLLYLMASSFRHSYMSSVVFRLTWKSAVRTACFATNCNVRVRLELKGTCCTAWISPKDAASSPRWKDLVKIVAEDEEGVSLRAVSVHPLGIDSTLRHRRPLLLYFPSHNDSSILGVHRCLVLVLRSDVLNINSILPTVTHKFSLQV